MKKSKEYKGDYKEAFITAHNTLIDIRLKEFNISSKEKTRLRSMVTRYLTKLSKIDVG